MSPRPQQAAYAGLGLSALEGTAHPSVLRRTTVRLGPSPGLAFVAAATMLVCPRHIPPHELTDSHRQRASPLPLPHPAHSRSK